MTPSQCPTEKERVPKLAYLGGLLGHSLLPFLPPLPPFPFTPQRPGPHSFAFSIL